MADRIEYCLGNADRLDHSGAEGRLCLQHCGLCHESAFLLVDGEPIAGESHETLLADALAEADP